LTPLFPIALGEQRAFWDAHLIDKAVFQTSGNLLLAGYPCLALESVFIVQAWHPRLDRDPAHQWLRQTIKQFFLRQE
jgi:hypothetical protein